MRVLFVKTYRKVHVKKDAFAKTLTPETKMANVFSKNSVLVIDNIFVK